MSYSIQITQKAQGNIKNICEYIYSLSLDINTVEKTVKKIFKAIDRLKIFPNIGNVPKIKSIKIFGFKYIIEGDYLIFYKIDEKQQIISIAAILNGKQDYVKVLLDKF